ncbi:hypothetical protein A8L45_05545 [Veronia pacifica]|uniref:Uncharacterized protein n=1 Tax=Veronia pacifica TaxID=1080227 RepID=A0A1C3EPH1_9GAMM|nr:hypothetical protein A8L45_05545 [Veronia pacifica]
MPHKKQDETQKGQYDNSPLFLLAIANKRAVFRMPDRYRFNFSTFFSDRRVIYPKDSLLIKVSF